jgi:1,4-alpha-glucan branching enzyme
VAVAGSFNEWNPETAQLHSTKDGWWEIRIDLIPGVYEYAYLVDGVWTTPPEAKITVEDGFGGNNGILEVLPSGL